MHPKQFSLTQVIICILDSFQNIDLNLVFLFLGQKHSFKILQVLSVLLHDLGALLLVQLHLLLSHLLPQDGIESIFTLQQILVVKIDQGD